MLQPKLVVRGIRLGVKTLLLHKLRSFLTILGVVFGVSSVIAMLAVGEGASADALEEIRRLGSNNIIISTIRPSEETGGGAGRKQEASIYGLLYEDELRIRETIPGVRRTVPAKVIRKEGRLGSRTLDVRIVGTTPAWFELVQRRTVAGRLLRDRDLSDHRAVCVLTEHGARRLLATSAVIGQSVRLNNQTFEVVGIVESQQGSGAIQTPDRSVDAYIPLSVSRQYFGDVILERAVSSISRQVVELHHILVEAESMDQVLAVEVALEAMFGRFHEKKDYQLDVPLALRRQAEATKRRFNIVLGSIAGISLLVGGIGIMNIMLASVTERIREIGVRRAIGAKRHQIVLQFLIETVVLASAGGGLGTALGMLVPWLITQFAGMPTVVTPWSLLISLGISMGVGIVFGLYPALAAANLDPIEALRHE